MLSCLQSVRYAHCACAATAMLISRVSIFVFLPIVIKDITGFEKSYLINDDEDHSDVNNGSGQITIIHNDNYDDAYSSYSDYSFHHELDGLTSNGMINITTDVILLSIVTLSGLENFTIIGHDNATVNCDNAGGIHFVHCHNCTIIGIKWEKCGNKNDNKPAIQWYNSSDISIQNCSFQNSLTQSITLSEMSGNVTINGCTYAFNNYYEDHGVAIHYLSKIQQHSKLQFTISNCNFTHNGMVNSQSIVYIGPSSNKITEHIFFTNSVFLNNKGSPIFISHQNVFITGNMLLMQNVALFNPGIFINNHTKVTFHKSYIKFENNKFVTGGVLHIAEYSNSIFKGNSVVTINNNIASFIGCALFIRDKSDLKFEGNSTVTINNNQNDYYAAVCISGNSDLKFEGKATVTINNNHGGAVYVSHNSDLKFEGSSTVTINNNQDQYFGGGIFIRLNSYAIFKGNSTVTINDNQANNGGAVYIMDNSDVTFGANSTVTINNNQAKDWGGAIYITLNSNATFEGNSTVTINNNQADNGGAVSIWNNSDITITGISKVAINNNTATNIGGALHIEYNSDATFEGNSTVTINNNQADNGGAAYIQDNSDLKFEGNCTVAINNNHSNNRGGAIYIALNSNATFERKSTVTINNNQADNGGAVYILDNSDMKFEENSTVTINNNEAKVMGGAIYITLNSDATFEGNSAVEINNNQAENGGAIYIWDNSNLKFEEKSTVTITNNQADNGGAVYISENSDLKFEGNSTVTINDNQAKDWGGAIYIKSKCNVTFEGNSTVTINNNQAFYGGAFNIRYNSIITFERNSVVTIKNNQASDGGALYIWVNSDVTFKGNSTVTINNNQASDGAALYIQQNSSAIFNGSSLVTFDNNTASTDGGALYANNNCSVEVKGNSTIIFNNNQASGDGGAIYFNNHVNVLLENSSTVILNSNTADNYGGAIYTKSTNNANYFNINEIVSNDNRARVAGNLLYFDVPKSYNVGCLTDNSTVRISNNIIGHSQSEQLIATSPSTLILHYPAKCISNDSVGCEKYYIENIMLGQEIAIPACLLDYCNRPAEATQFRTIGNDHQNYSIYGSPYTSVSCNHSIEGISIIGNEAISGSSLNYSMLFTSHISLKSVRKSIVVNLTVELSPCHPGFLYHSKSQKCECYNNSGIVYCSDSSSAIKRGYWFGHVTGIPTVTFCPINYCNFTCCKTTTGYHQLSPTRNNQCRLHRVGIACGSCQKGYTLPYYSSECVSIDKCTMTWTIVIIILTILYWVAIVAVVFILMHYQISIGKLYAITYYYSIVDALLSDNSDDLSDGMYTFINIMYSIAKLTPQFLGKLRLVKGISGIDQQFIHYIHPLAVAFILLIVSLLARCSHRISSLPSRAIIRVICFLLLLSYTSVTTTSLLLLKYLKFSDVTKVYTHSSPDTEYFHGRHLAYGIIAIICTITVVIGLPFLLLLEPFINHKINFTKIKPILDQFQGCYKDKYRCFAAYYMIC